MEHWHVELVGYPENETGDVIAEDGEYLGTWTNDENDIATFTPDGADKPIISDMFLGPFCRRIKEWHEGRQ